MDNHGKQYCDQGTGNYLEDTIQPKVLEEFHTEGLQKDVIEVMKYLDRVPLFFILLLLF
jgi:protein involved in ribonucleotide reduction